MPEERRMARLHPGPANRVGALMFAGLAGIALVVPARGQQPDAPARPGPDPAAKAAPERAKAKPARPKAKRDRRGFYMGRQIAEVMSWQGADWLFRETRVEEE